MLVQYTCENDGAAAETTEAAPFRFLCTAMLDLKAPD